MELFPFELVLILSDISIHLNNIERDISIYIYKMVWYLRKNHKIKEKYSFVHLSFPYANGFFLFLLSTL